MPRKVLGRGLSALMPVKSSERGSSPGSLEISQITFNPFQPRQEIDAEKLSELVASIKEKGVIQPIIVRTKDEGYELIAGERRLRAAQELGFSEVPAIIKDVDDAEALQLALIENIQREELNPLEEAQAYQQLISDFGFTHEKVARMLGKDASTISNTLRLLKLPPEIQSALRKGTISMGHARTILGMKTLTGQDEVYQRTLSQRLSVRQLEQLVAKKRGTTPKKKKFQRHDPHLVALEEELQRILGTKVRIISGRKRGKIIFEYYSAEDLERIINSIKTIK